MPATLSRMQMTRYKLNSISSFSFTPTTPSCFNAKSLIRLLFHLAVFIHFRQVHIVFFQRYSFNYHQSAYIMRPPSPVQLDWCSNSPIHRYPASRKFVLRGTYVDPTTRHLDTRPGHLGDDSFQPYVLREGIRTTL